MNPIIEKMNRDCEILSKPYEERTDAEMDELIASFEEQERTKRFKEIINLEGELFDIVIPKTMSLQLIKHKLAEDEYLTILLLIKKASESK